MSSNDLLYCAPEEFAQALGRTLHGAVDAAWEDDGQESKLKWNEFTQPCKDLSINGLKRHLSFYYLFAAGSARDSLGLGLDLEDQGRTKRWNFLNHPNAIQAFVESFHGLSGLQKVFEHATENPAYPELPLLERLLRAACVTLQNESLKKYKEVSRQIVALKQKHGEKPSDFLRKATDLYQRSGGVWRCDPASLKGAHLLSKLDEGLQTYILDSQQYSETSLVNKRLPLHYSQTGGEEKVDGVTYNYASMTDLDEIATAYWRVSGKSQGNGNGNHRGSNANGNGKGNHRGGNGNHRGGGQQPKQEGAFFLTGAGYELVADYSAAMGSLAFINPRTLGDLDDDKKAAIKQARVACAKLIGAGTKLEKTGEETGNGGPKLKAAALTTENIRDLYRLRKQAHVCFNCFSPHHLVNSCPYLHGEWAKVGKEWKAVADKVRATSTN